MTTTHRRGFAPVTKQKSGRYAVRYTDGNDARRSAGKTFARKRDARGARRRDRPPPGPRPTRTQTAAGHVRPMTGAPPSHDFAEFL